jgi:hypothetical protein
MLIGARARLTEFNQIELVAPHPGGVRGAYVFNWSAVNQFCQLSLHDMALTERVSALQMVTPATIREVAREVAVSGLAGRVVADAAVQAALHDQQAEMITNFNLLMALMRQIEQPMPGQLPPEHDEPTRMRRRTHRAIAAFAPQLGLKPDRVSSMLEELAVMFTRIGIGDVSSSATSNAHLPRLVRELRRFRRDLAAWGALSEGSLADAARSIAAEAESTLQMVEPMIARCHERSRDVVQLLRDNIAAPAKLAADVARPDWVLDGWELICLRWRACDPDQREDVIEELAAMLPPIPDEAESFGFRAERELVYRGRRKVLAGRDWRSGLAVFDAIERSEAVLRLVYEGEAA